MSKKSLDFIVAAVTSALIAAPFSATAQNHTAGQGTQAPAQTRPQGHTAGQGTQASVQQGHTAGQGTQPVGSGSSVQPGECDSTYGDVVTGDTTALFPVGFKKSGEHLRKGLVRTSEAPVLTEICIGDNGLMHPISGFYHVIDRDHPKTQEDIVQYRKVGQVGKHKLHRDGPQASDEYITLRFNGELNRVASITGVQPSVEKAYQLFIENGSQNGVQLTRENSALFAFRPGENVAYPVEDVMDSDGNLKDGFIYYDGFVKSSTGAPHRDKKEYFVKDGERWEHLKLECPMENLAVLAGHYATQSAAGKAAVRVPISLLPTDAELARAIGIRITPIPPQPVPPQPVPPQPVPPQPNYGECNDKADNDGDGKVDAEDPDCVRTNYVTETGIIPPVPPPLPPPPVPPRGECNDEVDNDGDGLVDKLDPDCERTNYTSESGLPPSPVPPEPVPEPSLDPLHRAVLSAGPLYLNNQSGVGNVSGEHTWGGQLRAYGNFGDSPVGLGGTLYLMALGTQDRCEGEQTVGGDPNFADAPSGYYCDNKITEDSGIGAGGTLDLHLTHQITDGFAMVYSFGAGMAVFNIEGKEYEQYTALVNSQNHIQEEDWAEGSPRGYTSVEPVFMGTAGLGLLFGGEKGGFFIQPSYIITADENGVGHGAMINIGGAFPKSD